MVVIKSGAEIREGVVVEALAGGSSGGGKRSLPASCAVTSSWSRTLQAKLYISPCGQPSSGKGSWKHHPFSSCPDLGSRSEPEGFKKRKPFFWTSPLLGESDNYS